MPRVSIIVPVYNVEQYVERCLDSLLAQTEKDIEIIVINDGTKDNSQVIIDRYVKEHPGKIISLIKENGGLSDARNFGIPYASGEYIAFLDSDDYVEQQMYETLLYATENGKKNIVACGYSMDWADRSRNVIDEIPNSLEDYLLSGLVVAWNKIYKREWLLSKEILFPKGLLYEDTEFFCKLIVHVKTIEEVAVVQEPYIHYIQRANSISYSEESRIDDIHCICQNIKHYYEKKNVSNSFWCAFEYKLVKTLLGNFLLKYCRISDKTQRKSKLKENWKFIHRTFPNWKNNPYICKKGNRMVKLYLKTMNYLTYSIVTYIHTTRLEIILGK